MVRFYKASSFSKFRPYTLTRCTEVSSFVSIMDESSDESFVISVIENFVANRVKSNPAGDVAKIIDQTTGDLLKVIKTNQASERRFACLVQNLLLSCLCRGLPYHGTRTIY